MLMSETEPLPLRIRARDTSPVKALMFPGRFIIPAVKKPSKPAYTASPILSLSSFVSLSPRTYLLNGTSRISCNASSTPSEVLEAAILPNSPIIILAPVDNLSSLNRFASLDETSLPVSVPASRAIPLLPNPEIPPIAS